MNEVDYIVKKIISELKNIETDTVELGDEVHFEVKLSNVGLSPSDNADAIIKFTYQVNKQDKEPQYEKLTSGVNIVIDGFPGE